MLGTPFELILVWLDSTVPGSARWQGRSRWPQPRPVRVCRSDLSRSRGSLARKGPHTPPCWRGPVRDRPVRRSPPSTPRPVSAHGV